MSEGDSLVFVFMPALAPLLVRAEDLKGSLLTEDEVLRIRDGAVCVAMPPAVAIKVKEQRGYEDIDPEDCWALWQRLRADLGRA